MTAELELAKIATNTLALGPVGNYLGKTDALRAMVVSSDTPPGDLARKVLAMTATPVEERARYAAQQAYTAGASDAFRVIGNKNLGVGSGASSANAGKMLDGLDFEGRIALNQAKELARTGATDAEIAAPILGHANKVRARVSDSITTAGNEGTAEIAGQASVPLVWVAETNACVACLAYSGYVVAHGEQFPGGLTYGAKSYQPDAIDTPPRHPNCRCTIEPLNDQSYADALRREADRSVLRGFSLESESMATRIDAAERLAANPNLIAPKSVIAYAKRSVKAGEFATRGRPLGPTGPPPNAPKTPPAGPSKPPPSSPPRAPKTPPVVPSSPGERWPVNDNLVADYEAKIAQKQHDYDLYSSMPGPRMAKHAKRVKGELDPLKSALRVEKLGGATPGLDALPKRPPASLSTVVGSANPGRDVRVYDNNCGNAVAAAELRARGHNVIAAARPGRQGRVSSESAAAWRTPDGKVRDFTTGQTKEQVVKIVESWPEGSRGFVSGQWAKGRSGHIFSVENKGGRAVFHEPQVPTAAEGYAAGHLDKLQYNRINVLRVDDLVPTDALAEYVVADEAKLRATLAAKAAKKTEMGGRMTELYAQITELDRINRILVTTEAEKAARLARLAGRDKIAVEYIDLRKKYMRL